MLTSEDLKLLRNRLGTLIWNTNLTAESADSRSCSWDARAPYLDCGRGVVVRLLESRDGVCPLPLVRLESEAVLADPRAENRLAGVEGRSPSWEEVLPPPDDPLPHPVNPGRPPGPSWIEFSSRCLVKRIFWGSMLLLLYVDLVICQPSSPCWPGVPDLPPPKRNQEMFN